jgi:hypothetical protein
MTTKKTTSKRTKAVVHLPKNGVLIPQKKGAIASHWKLDKDKNTIIIRCEYPWLELESFDLVITLPIGKDGYPDTHFDPTQFDDEWCDDEDLYKPFAAWALDDELKFHPVCTQWAISLIKKRFLPQFKDEFPPTAKELRQDPHFVCTDCSFDTLEGGEYYMVHDDLWEAHGCGDGMLCIGCLEDRMGTTLQSDDFALVPINAHAHKQSGRLIARINGLE